MAQFDIGKFEKMFHSEDKDIALRTCDNAEKIIPYAGRKVEPDQALKDELQDFNNFAQAHMGYTVYDLTGDLMDSGIKDVLDHLVLLGRSK